MRLLFSREEIIRRMIRVEVVLLQALAEVGIENPESIKVVLDVASTITPSEIEEEERRIGHDVMAMAVVLAKKAGDAGKMVHFGATSYDIVDTAYALIFRDALDILKRKLVKSLDLLSALAIEHADTLMVGRTHGQHALPITFGFKLANYVYELTRSLERLKEVESRLLKVKMAGAVGTAAGWGEKGGMIQLEVSKRLGLSPHEITTQIAPRDGHAELISDLAILGSQLDRFALEVRELMRPEIAELAESVPSRVGSSTMPQKENPVLSEKICGLAKVLRGFVVPALENIPTWHERDLTNSSSERILLSHSLLIIDEMLDSFIQLLSSLKVNKEKMMENLELSKGNIMAESLMLSLTRKGIPRHVAHSIVSELSRKSSNLGLPLISVAIEDQTVKSLLNNEELHKVLDPSVYLGQYREMIERAINYFKGIREEFAAVAQR
ncbi:adenylosuccinate lyase [Sulfodiicoccus acidiphilus]|uniref:Adenylosuccinate lyase n=2 Tax=Sulfodiicoccus acidiphilus TaxID=1670455 RepID=A0A348B0C2_9CREN|nr:adenylosuccinate lyase [Sulfodiicoccus acidiphilus]GGT87013.1 adenylosuccinate lyase [Sulfodiicoccus acidiphilus]